MAAHSKSSVTREYIHGRSWSSWLTWWIMKLFLPVIKRKDVTAPHGPQTLDYPPPNRGACDASRWEYKDWTMVQLNPPKKNGHTRSRRVMMCLYGSGFKRLIH